ncbi:hypothetical protein, partial [Burkholderia sp. Se-20373]|uniref:hypothetical protein n=1 Tax=Burkholderia sp. Se-20373 TaxID=2703898 RepID=UPI00197DD42A
MPDLFAVSGHFPGNPQHARVAWKIPGYLKQACQPGKTLIIPPAQAHSTGLAACGPIPRRGQARRLRSAVGRHGGRRRGTA